MNPTFYGVNSQPITVEETSVNNSAFSFIEGWDALKKIIRNIF